MGTTPRMCLLSGVAMAAAMVLAGALAPAATSAKAAPFVTYNTATHAATIQIIAGYNSSAAGFNFDWGAHGSVVITVPLNAKVTATFVNYATLPHSAVIVPYRKTLPAKSSPPAFKGAASADYLNGAEKGDPATTFKFSANKAGTFLLICGVPGHAAAGMWDLFVVSPTAKTVISAGSRYVGWY